MDDREKALFPLDLTDFDWDEYNYYFGHGLMRYVLKSDLNPIPPDALRKYNVNETPWKPKPKVSGWKDYMESLIPDLSHTSAVWEGPALPTPPLVLWRI